MVSLTTSIHLTEGSLLNRIAKAVANSTNMVSNSSGVRSSAFTHLEACGLIGPCNLTTRLFLSAKSMNSFILLQFHTLGLGWIALCFAAFAGVKYLKSFKKSFSFLVFNS